MIISASRRTDIPAFYSKWLMNRLKEGYVMVPNPYNNKISRVDLSLGEVDCIVFWTKNPLPMIDLLPELINMGYKFYFLFSLLPYGKDVEENLPSKNELVNTFIDLSQMIGKEKVIWRYDPILISDVYTINWHLEQFEDMCKKLSGYTNRCIISFIDVYSHIKKNFREMNTNEADFLAKNFSKIAKKFNILLYTCAEKMDLDKYGISHSSCIDKNIIEEAIGKKISVKKNPAQRKYCECLSSVDIGVYNTCVYGCKYCYATSKKVIALNNYKNHDPKSSVLTGTS